MCRYSNDNFIPKTFTPPESMDLTDSLNRTVTLEREASQVSDKTEVEEEEKEEEEEEFEEESIADHITLTESMVQIPEISLQQKPVQVGYPKR